VAPWSTPDRSQAQRRKGIYPSPLHFAGRMEISARNQLPGKVVSTKLGSIMAEVAVEIDPATIVAAITRSSVEHLNLQPGDSVQVIMKSTEVIIGK
jgi:molybdopterin-binding protein